MQYYNCVFPVFLHHPYKVHEHRKCIRPDSCEISKKEHTKIQGRILHTFVYNAAAAMNFMNDSVDVFYRRRGSDSTKHLCN